MCGAQWEPCDDGWTVDSMTRGGWQGSRAMQVMFVLGLELALSKSDELAPHGLDDMTFIGSAAALDRSWNDIEGTLRRLGGYKCGCGRLGLSSLRTRSCRTCA